MAAVVAVYGGEDTWKRGGDDDETYVDFLEGVCVRRTNPGPTIEQFMETGGAVLTNPKCLSCINRKQ
jgi:hypothetical protein